MAACSDLLLSTDNLSKQRIYTLSLTVIYCFKTINKRCPYVINSVVKNEKKAF